MTLPEQLQSEYDALVSGRGFIELDNWSTVSVTGEDRISFVHNMCTNDIKRLNEDENCEAFLTDVKGKIVAHVLVVSCKSSLLMLTVPDQADTLIAHLDRYIIREDVQLTNVTADYAWFVAIPGKARTAWSDGEEIPHVYTNVYGSHSAGCMGVPAKLRAQTRESMANCGLQPCSVDAWEALRIEEEFPLFGVDFDGSNLPQEVNRDNVAISFDKGCYLGQETVARIDALGHVNRQVVSVEFESNASPAVGAVLSRGGQEAGRVTSVCWSPKRQAPLALAMVRREANEIGTKLECEHGSAKVVEQV